MAEPAPERFAHAVEAASLAVEGMAALLLACAAAWAFASLLRRAAERRLGVDGQRAVWLGLARWLVLALEFQLAADLLHTAVSRTWADIGQVAALALIRTFLNYTLEADLEKLAERRHAPEPPSP
ncbi:DUF1622 domain-containing protein [Longimicrobium sp.]|uniref:DUF1622 domain-containing protein n=1 Tax=Longimicrobium sp. TaxID=2029185 RepID=UPI002E368015|nr:DUF1622 domain-containing protein [Longimicrobium sp.]